MKDEDHYTSKLPIWKVTRLSPTKLGIQCPRKDCKGKAVVSRNWLKSRPQVGRSCTYCFKTNQIPGELR